MSSSNSNVRSCGIRLVLPSLETEENSESPSPDPTVPSTSPEISHDLSVPKSGSKGTLFGKLLKPLSPRVRTPVGTALHDEGITVVVNPLTASVGEAENPKIKKSADVPLLRRDTSQIDKSRSRS